MAQGRTGRKWFLAFVMTAMFMGTSAGSAAAALTGTVENTGGYGVGGAVVELYRYFNVGTTYTAHVEKSIALKETWRTSGNTAGVVVQPAGVPASREQSSDTRRVAAGAGMAAVSANVAPGVRNNQVPGAADASAQVTNGAVNTGAVPAGVASPTPKASGRGPAGAQPAGAAGSAMNAVGGAAGVLVQPSGAAWINTRWVNGDAGNLGIDITGDGVVDGVNYQLTDGTGDGDYWDAADTMSISANDGDYADGALGNNQVFTAGAGDDEVFGNPVGGRNIWFDNNNPADRVEFTIDFSGNVGAGWVTITVRRWYTGNAAGFVNSNNNWAAENMMYTLTDTNSDGIWDTIDMSVNDGDYWDGANDGVLDATNDERALLSETVMVGSNPNRYSYMVFLQNDPQEGNPDMGITSLDWFQGQVLIDTDGDGVADDPLNYATGDTNSNGLYDILELSTDDSNFGEGGALANDVTGANDDERDDAADTALLGTYTFSHSYSGPDGNGGFDLTPDGLDDTTMVQNTWYSSALTTDVDGDGALDNVNYVLTDADSDGVFDTCDLSADDAVYGEDINTLFDGSVSRPAVANDDERIWADGVLALGRYRFQVDFDANPARDNSDLRATAVDWYSGGINVDVDDDGVPDALNFALGDTNSNGRYETLEISIDDGQFGEGALADKALGINNDERAANNENPPLPLLAFALGGHVFTVSYPLNPAVAVDDLSITATEWYAGRFTADIDGDGAANDAINYALADTNSDGLYDTADLSTDDAVFGEGNLNDGATGADNDEQVTGTEVKMGTYNFDFVFDSNPMGDTADATLGAREWFTGTARIEGNARAFAFADSNSDGVFDTLFLDVEGNGNYNGPADANGVEGSTLVSSALYLEYTLANVSPAGKAFSIAPVGGSTGATLSWFVGLIGAGGVDYRVAVSDANGDSVNDTADFDRDGNGRLDIAGKREAAGDTVYLGGSTYQVLSIADNGSGVKILPYTAARLGPQHDLSAGGTVQFGTLSESDAAYDLDGDGDSIGALAAIVLDTATPSAYNTAFIDLDGDGLLTDETVLSAGSSFSLGPNSYDLDAVDSGGGALGLRQLNDMLASTTSTPGGNYTLSPPGAGYYWMKVTSPSSAWGYAVLNDTNGGNGYYYGGAAVWKLTLSKKGYDVSGTVTDSATALPLADVVVEAYGSTGQTVVSTTTKADGTYRIAVAGGSNYDLLFRKVGYITDDGRTGAGTVKDVSLTADRSGQDVKLTRDTTPPTVALLRPADGEVVSGTYTIVATASDNFRLESVAYSVDFGTTWREMSPGGANFTADWNTTELGDGNYRVIVRAVDNATLSASAYRSVYVGNERVPPSVRLIAPVDGEFLSGQYTVKLFVADNVGVRSVNFRLINASGKVAFEAPTTFNTASAQYEYALNTNPLADAAYTLDANVTDLALNRNTTAPIRVSVDNTPPVLSVNYPLEGSYISGAVFVNVTADDLFLSATEYSVDGGSWSPVSAVWNTTAVTDGPHVVSVRASDRSGKTTERRIGVTVDNSHPAITFLSPEEGAAVRGVVQVRFTVAAGQGLRSVKAGVEGKEQKELPRGASGVYELLLDTEALGYRESEVNVTVSAVNLAGAREDASRRLKVDNTVAVPGVVLGDRGDIIIAVTAKDTNGVSRVLVRVDGGAWLEAARAGEGKYQYTWRTGEADNGDHTVDVKVVDKLGNEAMKSVKATVKNPPYSYIAAAIAIVFAVAALGAMVWLKRRRGPSAALPPEPAHAGTWKAAPPGPPAAVPAEPVQVFPAGKEGEQGATASEPFTGRQ